MFIDASYFRVGDGKARRHRTKALLIVTGSRKDGYRDILGLKLADSEGEGFWLELFEELKERARVVGAFLNGESLIRLVVTILTDMNEKWLTGRRYLDM